MTIEAVHQRRCVYSTLPRRF